MAYPTTLALITALWSGPGRTKSIALWSALGGGIALLGPLISGALLEHFSWGSVFLVTLPLVAIALPMAIFFVPSHVNEGTEPVDNLGGDALRGARRRADRLDQLPAGAEREDGRARAARGRGRRRDPVLHSPAARRQSALRPPHRRPPDLLGRRLRGDHRLRLADGRRVHQPAVPAERARLLDARGGRRDHPRRPLHGGSSRRARPSSSGCTGRGGRCSAGRRSSSSPSC